LAAWLLAVALVAGASGCETTGESAGLGALIGAGAGAVIGGAAGGGDGALIGAAVGAAAGAATGAIVHDVRRSRAERVVAPEQTAATYNYQPSAGQSMVFEDASVRPAIARRGEFVEVRMQYALLGAPNGASITERRVLLSNNEIFSQISAEEHTRNDGTWVSTQEFRVGENWQPGEYVIEQTVSTSRLTVSGRVRLIVN
jgi:outer membrane lipoprotein SlyB